MNTDRNVEAEYLANVTIMSLVDELILNNRQVNQTLSLEYDMFLMVLVELKNMRNDFDDYVKKYGVKIDIKYNIDDVNINPKNIESGLSKQYKINISVRYSLFKRLWMKTLLLSKRLLVTKKI